jgi:hypothetical protein
MSRTVSWVAIPQSTNRHGGPHPRRCAQIAAVRARQKLIAFTAHPGRLDPVDPAAVWTITFHVLELVVVAVVLLLYLLIKVWRRI